ncbi:hypothetical protein KPL71_013401 [Citrus sinensis]|uniref:Uncharacterized protein n=1 Tax=Citrus sinensis TaxID=2711 RepID=A0ACB8LK55_CITSI|nr:hypothetical protein KPL71_013401 [Citrus sinensis]
MVAPLMEETEKGKSALINNAKPKIEEEEEEQQVVKVWSWGAGTDGQLGTGRLHDELSPQLLNLSSLSSVSMLACGGAHVLALTSPSSVIDQFHRRESVFMGEGQFWSVRPRGDGRRLVSIIFSLLFALVAQSASFYWDSGCLFTCGDGTFGQLGHGDYRSHCSPVKVSSFVNKNVDQIACGMRHSLVLLKDCLGNQVYGFGSGKRGQLGVSKDRIRSVSLPQVTIGLHDIEIVGISANGDRSAALSAEGHLYTWGRGFNSTSDVNCPQSLPSSLSFSQAALGWNHVLVLTGDGEVFMLGGSHHGMLSDPERVSSTRPLSGNASRFALEKVSNLDGVKVIQIAAGAEHSAVVTENRAIMTWGWGEHGQLGLGNTCDQIHPKVVNLGDEFQNRDTQLEVFCGSGFTYAISRHCLPSQT